MNKFQLRANNKELMQLTDGVENRDGVTYS